MGRTVLLLHQLPDGSSHFDWLTETNPDGPLLSFRTQDRLDHGPASFRAELLPDHRRVYLDYEGSVSADRGHVTRLAVGRAETSIADGRIAVSIDWGAGPVRYVGAPEPSAGGTPRSWWVFAKADVESPAVPR